MSELSTSARELLDGARRAGGPSPERRAQVTAVVMASVTAATVAGATAAATATAAGSGSVGAAGGVSVAPTVAAPVAAHAVVGGGFAAAKLVGVGVLAVITGAAGTVVVNRVAATSTKNTVAHVEPARSPARQLAPLVAAVPVTPTASTEDIAALSAALEALDAQRPAEALTLVRTALARSSAGPLRPELSAAHVLALCALGRVDEARAVASAMPSQDQTALVRARLGNSCAP
jgi:hypothetical protein